MSAPSVFAVQQAIAALTAARARVLIDDPNIGRDEELLADTLISDPATSEAMDCLHQAARAAIVAEKHAKAANEWAQEIKARADRYAHRAEILRGAVFAAMDALEIKRIEQPDFTARTGMGNGGIHVADDAELPDQYCRIKREPDKAKLREALERGEKIPGVSRSNGSPFVAISVK